MLKFLPFKNNIVIVGALVAPIVVDLLVFVPVQEGGDAIIKDVSDPSEKI
jgi:hypothetical protein